MKQESVLSKINNPEAIRELKPKDLLLLAGALRQEIIDVIATKEGHLGASLGVVELTIALHYVFNTPVDQLIWDVGHQAYGHKILTGRRDQFATNRQWQGLSGFPTRAESMYDAFGTGHASTSISAALGMALAHQQKNDSRAHIAVIGDASIAGGMALEALNHAGVSSANLIIVLNDNAIGIDPSVGALKHYFEKVKQENSASDNIFQALNIPYNGPVDGHDLPGLIAAFQKIQKQKGPRLIHVVTTKGKGVIQAELDQVTYHAPGKFDRKTGILVPKTERPTTKYQDVFGKTLVALAAQNDAIIGITPAMPTGSSMKLMMDAFPERSFDVGIAEQHAVTLAAGMATAGLLPFCAIYATFLQRAYDQVIHDVALQNLGVVFCLDRAGLVGQDGPTHHGVFDIAMLRTIPNMRILAPRNEIQLRNTLYTLQLGIDGPVAIRYPRGYGKISNWELPFKELDLDRGSCLKEGKEIAILSVGTMSDNVKDALELVQDHCAPSHYDLGSIKPLDDTLLHAVFQTYTTVLTVEDSALAGGAGSAVLEWANTHGYTQTLKRIGIPDRFIPHGTTAQLQKEVGLDAAGIAAVLLDLQN
ncbi:MAG: 1-deoxy-D-xylulose-5-phosphate synthase [Flavobacteriaceae bacterium]|nr:1-deoxy-D-xylulose-5-phosphate synthase [Flavobacteriaceae bacterium]MDG1090791.1 1-deoxy-D-xylulose-5-phosphate synthase [Flavobacteriaceae bacterium]